MSKTLQEIKEEYAKEHGCDYWEELKRIDKENGDIDSFELAMDCIAARYYEQLEESKSDITNLFEIPKPQYLLINTRSLKKYYNKEIKCILTLPKKQKVGTILNAYDSRIYFKDGEVIAYRDIASIQLTTPSPNN